MKPETQKSVDVHPALAPDDFKANDLNRRTGYTDILASRTKLKTQGTSLCVCLSVCLYVNSRLSFIFINIGLLFKVKHLKITNISFKTFSFINQLYTKLLN